MYLGFTVGAVAYETSGSQTHFTDKAVSGHNSNASNEDASDGFHVEDISLHKVHKHLTACRTIKVPGVKFPAQSSLIYISETIKAYEKKPVNSAITQAFAAPLFIKNCVFRI
ncbi:MAG: hypothetical protein WKG06_23300 [Segetibacter sp.]